MTKELREIRSYSKEGYVDFDSNIQEGCIIDTKTLECLTLEPLNDAQKKMINENLDYVRNVTESPFYGSNKPIVDLLTYVEINRENVISFIKSDNYCVSTIWNGQIMRLFKAANVEVTKELLTKEFGITAKKKSVRLYTLETELAKKFFELYMDDIIKYERLDLLALLDEEKLKHVNLDSDIMDIIWYKKMRYDLIKDFSPRLLYNMIKKDHHLSGVAKQEGVEETPEILRMRTAVQILNQMSYSSNLGTSLTMFMNIYYVKENKNDFDKDLFRCAVWLYLANMNKATYGPSLFNHVWTEELEQIRNEVIDDFFTTKPSAYKAWLQRKNYSLINYLFTDSLQGKEFLEGLPSRLNNKKLKKILMNSQL